MLSLSALSVRSNTPQASSSHLEPALEYVEAVSDSASCDTYSLHVADCHEYFANGILVSNCYDMVRYALMSRPPISDPLRVAYPIGSPEWAKREVEEMEQAALDKAVQDHKEDDPWAID